MTNPLWKLNKGLRNPQLILRQINRLYYRGLYGWRSYYDGVNIFDRDWDNIIILDACRYDTFSEMHTLDGILKLEHSSDTNTVGFLESNFKDNSLLDTVYVTANPQLHKHKSEISPNLFDWIDVWQQSGWHNKYKTVLPETMVEYAKDAASQYPNKRLVVHFIQPHHPFIGPTGREHFENENLKFWFYVITGDIDVDLDIVREAYKENVELTLPHVEELIDNLQGKTIVTADHGELFGEQSYPFPIKEYGHPRHIYMENLLKVPWFVCEWDKRREINEGTREAVSNNVSEDIVEDRLRELGYIE